MSTCPICGGERRGALSMTFLGRYEAELVHCRRCELLQVDDPHWLEEAYRSPIVAADTGLLQRNLMLAPRVANVFEMLDGGAGTYVDVAGGLGVLTRLLRDRGLDGRWHDPHADGILARGAEAPAGTTASALTAIEVLEHLADPVAFLVDETRRFDAPTIVFTTVLYDGDPPPPSWWYYAPEAGQHISFYTLKTLEVIASRLGRRIMTAGPIHIITVDERPGWRFRLAVGRFAPLIDRWHQRRREPLTIADHERLLRRAVESKDEEAETSE